MSYVKRFAVQSITRDREYDVCQGNKGSEMTYFTANPNGEAEKVQVLLRQLAKLKKLKIDLDFADIAVKGRGSKGNIVTKFPVKRIELKERGESTLEARKIWYDETVQRLNSDERGRLLGSFKGEDRLLIGRKNGTIKVVIPDLNLHFDSDMIYLEKLELDRPLSAVYFDGEKSRYFVKRFEWEGGEKEENIITAHAKSELSFLSNDSFPRIEMIFRKQAGGEQPEPEEVILHEFISVKGIKAKGNQLTTETLNRINGLDALPEPTPEVPEEQEEKVSEPEIKAGKEIDASTNNTSTSSEQSYNADDEAPQITLDF